MVSCRWFKKKNKVCNVILSAGAMRTLAQVGALEALENDGWKVKSICGISAGAIVASLYAYGVPLSEMRTLACEADFNSMKKFNLKNLKKGLFRFNGLGSWVSSNCFKPGL